MDFSLLDQSKSSSEEADPIADETRAYGCIFCKRGFTTAQALGGHMNIHRKDRTKQNPNSVPPFMSNPISTYRPSFYHPSSAPEPYIGFPATTVYYSFHSQGEEFFSSVQGGDGRLNRRGSEEGLVWGQTLNLQGGLSRVGDGHGVAEMHGGSEEEGVDLELRLGVA